MASGIRDKVALLGMGCSRFGERWDAGADELFKICSKDSPGEPITLFTLCLMPN